MKILVAFALFLSFSATLVSAEPLKPNIQCTQSYSKDFDMVYLFDSVNQQAWYLMNAKGEPLKIVDIGEPLLPWETHQNQPWVSTSSNTPYTFTFYGKKFNFDGQWWLHEIKVSISSANSENPVLTASSKAGFGGNPLTPLFSNARCEFIGN